MITQLIRKMLVAGLLLASHNVYAVDLNKLFDSTKEGGLGLGNVVGKLVEAGTMTPAKEQQIGREFAAVLLGSAPLLQDRAMQAYVNRVGRWLTLQTDRSAQPWRFGILDTPTVNAFATPGGNVFITRGLLERLRNETELAGVLGHEIAHVVLGHHVKAIRQGAFVDLGANLVNDKLDGKNEVIAEKLAGAVKTIYSRGLDKSAEFQADKLGVVIAARGGYDPYGLPSVLQTLEASEGSDAAFALLFKTHPTAQKRLTALLPSMQRIAKYAGSTDLNGDFPSLGKTGKAVARKPAVNPLVQSVQAELARLGYDPGPADGQFGKRSGDAIRAYQQANRLLVDGKASKPLLTHMQQQAVAEPVSELAEESSDEWDMNDFESAAMDEPESSTDDGASEPEGLLVDQLFQGFGGQ